MCPWIVIIFKLLIRLYNHIITPGPGTFKPYTSFNRYAIFIDFLDFIIYLSYDPGPGTLPKSYLSFGDLPSKPYDGDVYDTFL